MASASGAERWMACAASEALPHHDEGSPAASTGTRAHKFLELVNKHGRAEALDLAEAEHGEEWREVCEQIDIDRLPADGAQYAAEVALAYDTMTGKARELARGKDRRAAYKQRTAVEIPGTADVLGVAIDHVYVGDYKTGWGEVTPAAANGQLKVLALAAARVFGKPAARVEIIRVHLESGTSWRDDAWLDAMDLDLFAEQVKVAMDRIARAKESEIRLGSPFLRSGPWCKYCPAYLSCPAKMALAARIGSGAELEELQGTVITADNLHAIWDRAIAAERLIKKVKDSVAIAVRQHGPIEIGPDTYFGELGPPGRDKLDGDIVYDVLRATRGDLVAEAAVKCTATKAAIRDALRPALKPGEKITHVFDRMVDKVRERGGSQRGVTRSIKVFTAKEAEKAKKALRKVNS